MFCLNCHNGTTLTYNGLHRIGPADFSRCEICEDEIYKQRPARFEAVFMEKYTAENKLQNEELFHPDFEYFMTERQEYGNTYYFIFRKCQAGACCQLSCVA